MTRDQLEHAIRAVCDLTEDQEVYVFGSQAILGQFPNAPAGLLVSEEADISPKLRLDRLDDIDGMLGERSMFHDTFGFYVQGVPIHEAATLPPGWESRAVPVQNANTRGLIGWCVEAHDLAASKLAASRPKDLDFVRQLFAEGMIDRTLLLERVAALPIDEARRGYLTIWVNAL